MLQPIKRFKEYLDCARVLGRGPKERGSIFWRVTKNLRVRLKLGAYHPNDIYSLQTIYGPLHFRDNFGDITNLVGLFYQNVYRSKALDQDGVILDVGANIGLAAAWFALHNPGRPIYCFEPLRANAALVSMNCPTARVDQVAIGARRGRVKLKVDPDGVMASSIPSPGETREKEFEVISLDEVTSMKGIKKIALLKIDAEGMETEILDGAAQTLRKTHQIAIETHGKSRHEKAINCLLEAGFRIDAEEFAETTGLVFASGGRAGQA